MPKTSVEQLLREKTPGGAAPCRVGMGCASFGGADSPGRAARAVEAALDAGVVYFDVARSYGFGQAEAVLGKALHGRRDGVVLATKAGTPVRTLHPVHRWLRQRLVRPARWLRSALRSGARRGEPAASPAEKGHRTRNRQPPRFSAPSIAADLETSLKALKTDHVDLFHVHLCTLESLTDEVRDCLERVKREGKTRLLGVATGAAECARIRAACPWVDAFQLPDSVQSPGLDALEADRPESVITHSVLGRAPEARQALLEALRADGDATAFFRQQLGLDVSQPAEFVQLLILAALHRNARGVVLLGMGRPDHVRRNVSLTGREYAPEVIEEAWRRLQRRLLPAS